MLAALSKGDTMRLRTMLFAWTGSALVGCAALVWATGLASVLAAPAEPAAAPLIASAAVSGDQTALTITGLNLVTAGTENPNGALPSVSLALTPLPVMASSATSVTATLPSPLEAATYLLLLNRSDEQAAAFYVTVGAVGPQGPAGPAGPAGVGSGAVWQ